MVFIIEQIGEGRRGKFWGLHTRFPEGTTRDRGQRELDKLNIALRGETFRLREVKEIPEVVVEGRTFTQIIRLGPEKSKPTRTKKEQARILEKAGRLAEIEKQRRTGQITTREAIRLRQRPELSRGTVKGLTETKVTKIFQKVPFRSVTDIQKEKIISVVERARELRKAQLRAAGKEVIFRPSEKFFGIVPTGEGVKKVTKIPTETELVRELKAQKGFVTFVAPKKEEFKERKVEISVFKPIVVPVKPKPPKEAVTRLEKFEKRIELFKEREQRRAERFERAEKFISDVFPILRGKGFVRETIRKVPIVPFAFVDFLGSAVEKIEITGRGLLIPEAKPFVLKESKRAFVSIPSESKKIVTELFTTPTGVATLPFILLGTRVRLPTRAARARAVLGEIAKETPPKIIGEPFFRFEPKVIDVKTLKVLRKPGVEIKGPSDLVTTQIRALQPKELLTLAESVGGKTKFRTVTIGKQQVTTATRTFKGKDFLIRSTTDTPTGKTVTKVFRVGKTRELKLLRTIKTTEKPVITFTEPIRRISRKDVFEVDQPSRILEITKELKTTRGVSLVRKGFIPTGKGLIISQEFLRARIQRPAVTTRATVEIDLATGKTKLIPKRIDVAKERIKFVDFPPKQKPLIFEFGPGGLLVVKPSTVLTQQLVRLKAPFEITFAKRVRPGKIKQPKPTKAKLTDLDREILRRIEGQRKTISKEDALKFFEKRAKTTRDLVVKTTQKQKEVIREVQRPTPLQLKKFKQKFFLPEAETVFLRGARPIGIPLVIQKGVLRQMQQLTPKQIQQLRVVQEQRIKQEQILTEKQRLAEVQRQIQQQRTIQKQRLIQEPRLTEVQRVIQQQRLAQEQRVIQQQKLIEALEVPTERIPTAIFPTTFRPITTTPGVPGGFFFFLPDFPKGTGVPKPAFTTEVREGERKGDKFIRVRKRVLPKQRAINLGARVADNTTARTFRIKRRGTTTLPDTNRFPLKDKFRGRIGKSKLPPKVFVEKSKFAIDSPGERLGIPFNPIRIQRLREAQARKQARRVPRPLTTGRGRTMRFL